MFAIGKLSALVTHLDTFGTDAESRTLAREVLDFFSTTVRQHHEDEERHVFPRLVTEGDPETVQAVLRLCARASVPFVARGAGTGLSGGALPVADGVVVSLARMNRILEIDL